MAKINQQQVLEFLSSRKEELQKELTKIDTALAALKELDAPKRKYTRSVAAKPLAAAGRKKAAAAPKKQPKRATRERAASASLPPMDDRIVQVLSEIGPSPKSVVIQEMTARYPKETSHKLSRGAALRLSMMAKSGKLQSQKQDDQLIYSLPG